MNEAIKAHGIPDSIAGHAQSFANGMRKETYVYKLCRSGKCGAQIECTCGQHHWKVTTNPPSYTRLTVIKPQLNKEF